jgi:predicted CoA-binding protein
MSNARLIAVVGLVDDPSKPSYAIAAYQQSQGYKVIPVNPNTDAVLGHKAVDRLDEIQEPIDIVNVFTHGAEAPGIVDDAIRVGAKAVWLQPGVNSHEAVAKAQSAGMTVVSDKCFKTEHQRLLADRPM